MSKSPRKKSATPSRPSRKNGARQNSVKREPPEIDLSAIRPPSPTEDPLLLSARRAKPTVRSRVTPVFSSSPPVSTNNHADGQDSQWDAWTDSDSEGEGEYTGRFKMFHVPTKADPPTSSTKAHREWGRPVSPFPYEARLDRSLPDPQDMDVACSEDEVMEANLLDALDVESVFEDIVEVPPASDDLSNGPPTSDFHIDTEESQDSDVSVESDVIRITGSDPKAAARAAAILRLHDYDCVLASSNHAVRKPGTTFVGAGTAKRRSTIQGRHAIHDLEHRTPLCDIEDIMQDKTFIEQHTPVKPPSRVSPSHSDERASLPSSSTTCTESRYKPKAGEWRREDWKLLDKCFFEESHVGGVMIAPEEVNREAVVVHFKHLVGGHDVVMELGSPWSWENLLARVDVLVKKRAARTDLSTLSFASFMSRDMSILANVTPAPLSRIPRYRDLLDEASALDMNVPIYTSSYAARSQPTIVPSNRLAEKTGFFSRLPTWTSLLPRRAHIKPDDHSIQDCPPLPPPPIDIVDRRKPVVTPARKPSEQQKPHRDLVNLHHTSPPQKRVRLCRSQPKRLIELRHISPDPPFQHVPTSDRRARRSSGGSVKDLVRCFEVTKNLEQVTGGPREICTNTLDNRLAWKP
ncbi:hypothetical protein AZE42_09395 [Rhizopogon vesiculosus]|uniref:Uncharacterized protein n=1 Tax=Rhizopogon vesiculosus TaxID=180088 RepID=A0A1J8Q901_9AGAM|nr:hypothetical protein AZE42_09395 [Rhizopogon vesiculosus]